MGPNLRSQFVTSRGYAFFRTHSALGCAPLLAKGGVDWEAWTIVEECPVTEKEEIERVLLQLGCNGRTLDAIMTGIAWY